MVDQPSILMLAAASYQTGMSRLPGLAYLVLAGSCLGPLSADKRLYWQLVMLYQSLPPSADMALGRLDGWWVQALLSCCASANSQQFVLYGECRALPGAPGQDGINAGWW